MRYLEYDILTGQILSEIISETTPEAEAGIGVIEVNSYESFDPSRYIVKNGVITKAYETKTEQLERERLREEHREHAFMRIKSMMVEDFIARMERDDYAIEELRKEYNSMKAYL